MEILIWPLHQVLLKKEPKEVEAGILMQFIATPGKLLLAKLTTWHGVKNVRAPVFDVTTEAKVTLLMACCKL